MPPVLMHPETAALLASRGRRRKDRAIAWMLLIGFGLLGLYTLAERLLQR